MSNSLAEVHPELVSEWSEKNLPLTPDDITFGSNKKVWWKGACGHEWKTSVKARSNGEKCPICSGAIGRYLLYLKYLFFIEKSYSVHQNTIFCLSLLHFFYIKKFPEYLLLSQ